MKQGLYYLKFSVILFILMTLAFFSMDAFANVKRQRSIALGHEVIVAVIDTGVDLSHPSLKDQLWINSGEWGMDEQGRNKANNNKDDDHNGFIDDVHGWNFCHNNKVLKDEHGHGTHIAGIINQQVNQNLPRGLQSFSKPLRLMILKYHDSKGCQNGVVYSTVQAIKYATKMGAHIINYSSGGMSQDFAEQQAIQQAGKKGILLVAAAGNQGRNLDHQGYYPASYKLNNIISVGSVNSNNIVSEFSNFGAKSVDVLATGKDIYSTLPGGQYGKMSGTSQATAVVTGNIAKYLSQSNDKLKAEHLRQLIINKGKLLMAAKAQSKYGVVYKYQLRELQNNEGLKKKPS